MALSTECTLKSVVQSRSLAVALFSTLPQSMPAAPVAVTSRGRPGTVGPRRVETLQSRMSPKVPHVPYEAFSWFQTVQAIAPSVGAEPVPIFEGSSTLTTEKIVEQSSALTALSTECTEKVDVQDNALAVAGFSTFPQSIPAAPVAVTSNFRPGVVGWRALLGRQSRSVPKLPQTS